MMKIAHLYPRTPGIKGGILHYAGILERELSLLAAVEPVSRPVFPFFSAASLAREIAERGCTAAILEYTPNLYGWRNFFPVRVLQSLRKQGVRTLTLFHEIFMPDYASAEGRWIMRPVNAVKDRLCLRATDVPVVTFHYRAESLRERYHIRCETVPVFSNVPPYEGPPVSKTHLLGFFGTLHHDVLLGPMLSAARLLKTKVLFIGAAPSAQCLPADLADVTGWLPPWEVSHLLQTVNYFVVCDRRGISFRKGSVAAALMSGVPVIANRTDWTDAEFRHNENVCLYDGSAQGLADAVRTLEAQPALARKIGEGGRALYRAKMEPRLAATALFKLLSEGACA